MTPPDHLFVRDTRDRVVDLLGLGRAAPLQDVELEASGRVIPVDTRAELVIDPGQPDVRYLLRLRDGGPVGAGHHTVGTGGPTVIRTPPIEDDITFRILARRTRPGPPPPREAFLHAVTELRVGLDPSLPARIDAPLLEPEGSTADSAPRLVDHGTTVRVEVDGSQPGVTYEVLTGPEDNPTVISTAPVNGDSSTIVIETVAATEDAVLTVRASRSLSTAARQEVLLDARLPLKVRADTTLGATVDEPIVDHGATVTVGIDGSQTSVVYRLWGRTVHRTDFWYDELVDGADVATVAVPVEGHEPARLRIPGHDQSATPIGLAELAAAPGNGGRLVLDAGVVTDDLILAVTGTKDHDGVETRVVLDTWAAALARPAADQALRCVVPIEEGTLAGEVRVGGGQPGVRYRLIGGGQPIGRYVSFVEPDPTGARPGIEVLRIGVDWSVADGDVSDDPLVDVAPLTVPTTLSVEAVRARTGVSASLDRALVIDDGPVIELEATTIAPGETAKVLVRSSVVGERYRPYIDGEPIRRARNGDGSDLVFVTEPLTESTAIEVWASVEATAAALAVERRFVLAVAVEAP